ncbi:Lipase maturation factor 2 [Trichinella nelsoni]|uniref:Lipase maturation factor n=1 Tax=Trichinella nelsoni TaxID=6336 RepID=A0A0V0SKU8_9BILA|nr:Lipase maturation factor 2 [Trichinella nelsoni]
MHPLRVRELILRMVSAVFLWAFASFYHQVPGLYGDEGILPVRSVLKCKGDIVHCAFLNEAPTAVYIFQRLLFLSPSQALEATALLGMIVAALSCYFLYLRSAIIYFILWYLYFSCVQVGQDFMDMLLLEVGFLSILLAPFRMVRKSPNQWLPHDNVTLFLFRWLAFRLMFQSGISKLLNQDKTWWSLTALHYHFASQCLPTYLAWYAHQASDSFKQFSVAATFTILIFLPLFGLSPSKHLRTFAFYDSSNVVDKPYRKLQFFQHSFGCYMPGYVSTHKWKPTLKWKYPFFRWCFIFAGYGLLGYVCWLWFSVREVKNGDIQFSLRLEAAKFHSNLSYWLPFVCFYGISMFFSEIYAAFVRCWADFKHVSVKRRLYYAVQCVVMCLVASSAFAISLVPFSYIDRNMYDMYPTHLKKTHQMLEKYKISSSYGLFSSMTGVEGRPELIVEGSNALNGSWVEYNFLYKVGPVDEAPLLNIPHQPRLDWQMWFAALTEKPDESPWFISFVYRLLTNSKAVLDLMDAQSFTKTPKYVRASMYRYNFTAYDSKRRVKDWWTRSKLREYLPAYTADDEGLIGYLKKRNYIVLKPNTEERQTWIHNMLKMLRNYSSKLTGVQFVHAVTVAVYIPIFLLPKAIGISIIEFFFFGLRFWLISIRIVFRISRRTSDLLFFTVSTWYGPFLNFSFSSLLRLLFRFSSWGFFLRFHFRFSSWGFFLRFHFRFSSWFSLLRFHFRFICPGFFFLRLNFFFTRFLSRLFNRRFTLSPVHDRQSYGFQRRRSFPKLPSVNFSIWNFCVAHHHFVVPDTAEVFWNWCAPDGELFLSSWFKHRIHKTNLEAGVVGGLDLQSEAMITFILDLYHSPLNILGRVHKLQDHRRSRNFTSFRHF